MTVRQRTSLAFFVILLLFGLNLGIHAWSDDERHRTIEALDKTLKRQSLLASIRHGLHDRHKQVVLIGQVFEGPVDEGVPETEILAFDDHLAQIATWIRELYPLADARERAEVARFEELFGRLWVSWRSVLASYGVRHEQALAELAVRSEPLSEQVFRELLPGLEASGTRRVQESRVEYRRVDTLTNRLTMLCFALSIAVAFGVALGLSRRLRSGFGALETGTIALGRGDLHHRIALGATDEFGELGLAFNEMADKLVTAREDLVRTNQELEERNTALVASHHKLEDLYGTRAVTFERLRVLSQDVLPALEESLHRMRRSALPDASTELQIATRKVAELRGLLKPLNQLYSTVAAMRSKRVLLAESDRRRQITAKMALGGTGLELDVVSDVEAARQKLETEHYDIMLSDASMLSAIPAAAARNPDMSFLLVTSDDVESYLRVLDDYPQISTAIAIHSDDRASTVRNISTTVSKVISRDYFGIEKYLLWGTEIVERPVIGSQERHALIQEMGAYFQKLGLRKTQLTRSESAAEELLMNAVYDAPIDGNGKPLYNHLARTVDIELEPKLRSELRYGCDGLLAAVSVVDPFGALERRTILDYLLSCFEGRAGTLNAEKGGAGRGLHQLLHVSSFLVFNVEPGVRTEVIALFDVDLQVQKVHGHHALQMFYPPASPSRTEVRPIKTRPPSAPAARTG